jgi:hypothetical protein
MKRISLYCGIVYFIFYGIGYHHILSYAGVVIPDEVKNALNKNAEDCNPISLIWRNRSRGLIADVVKS